MQKNLKPANAKARALLGKLMALAERGIDGERQAAQRKLKRLKARFDFSAPDPAETPDLFSGRFKPATKARPIFSFGPDEFEIANSVKWAIESATRISCVYRDRELRAEASAPTAKRLEEIARHIAACFRALLDQFNSAESVSTADRGSFVRGLYDGMMNEARDPGQPLPGRPGAVRKQKRRKGATPRAADAAPRAAALHVHPYTLAVGLGRQIRFSAPVERIAAELEATLRKGLMPAPEDQRPR